MILFGTPSNGITHNVFKEIWKNKIEELVHGSPYIKKLREDWLKEFNDSYPFTFKTVAATRDEYVSKESALEPFKEEHWENIGGDHATMVKVTSKSNDGYELILKTLTDNPFFNKYTNAEEINIALGEYDEVVRKLKPALDYLNTNGLEKLIYAMECSGLREEAIDILENHELSKNDSDMLHILGNLFKNEYLNNTNIDEGLSAYSCYKKALRIAKKQKVIKQMYLNAINLAFLNLMLQADKRDMKSYAKLSLEYSSLDSNDSVSKLATIGEANIYLGNLDQAKLNYSKAAKKADIREKISIHTQAYTAYMTLNRKKPNQEFLDYLKHILLK